MRCAKSVTTKLGNEKTEIREWECSLNCEDSHKSNQQKPQRRLSLESNRQRFTLFKIQYPRTEHLKRETFNTNFREQNGDNYKYVPSDILMTKLCCNILNS